MNYSKNKYEKEAQRKTLMGLGEAASIEKKKEGVDYKKTFAQTGRDILIGGIGGGLMGTVMGRYSFLTGIVVTGIGHALNSPATSGFGIGLMASGGFQGVGSINGTDGVEGIEGVKERLSHYKENIKKQFFIDKLQKGKTSKSNTSSTEESTNGLNNVQYFRHPNPNETELNGNKDLDFTEANRLEQQLEASANHFAQKQGMSGDFSGTESQEMEGLDADISERLI